jgi:predicted O-methyltransferase YrrM
MASRTINLNDRVYEYLVAQSVRDQPVLKALRAETAKLPQSLMQISPEQGQFMALLVQLIGARRTIEVGTFTGYSALVVAQALPANGKVIACDVSEAFTAVARRYWARAKVAKKIDLRLAPAKQTLDRLLAAGEAGRFDFAFIDADKGNYGAYYERCLKLLRRGGLIAIDNVLWGGEVANPNANDVDTRAIRALNKKLKGDKRVSISMVPIGDGLTLARKL